MAKKVMGPFQLAWGSNPIVETSEVTFNYDQDSNDYTTVQGQKFTLQGAIASSVDVTFLASDVATLRVFLPQYYVAPGEKMSTGETVSEESGSEGAIDIVAAQCDTSETTYPLDVISCNGEVTRIPNAKVALTGVELDNNILRTVTLQFSNVPQYDAETGKPAGSMQFFQEGMLEES